MKNELVAFKLYCILVAIGFTQNAFTQDEKKGAQIISTLSVIDNYNPKPIIENKHTVYKDNSELYDFHVFTSKNSSLKVDDCNTVCVDANNVVWVGTKDGIARIDSGKMTIIDVKTTIPFNKPMDYYSVSQSAVDSHNNKWFIFGIQDVCKYDGKKWTVYNLSNSPLMNVMDIYADEFGNVWFSTFNGLMKFNGKRWSVMNNRNSRLTDNHVVGVFVDSRERLWVGTIQGTIVIDKKNPNYFVPIDCPLIDTPFEVAQEDRSGNIWFVRSKLNKSKNGVGFSTNGVVKLSSTGEWSVINVDNSGLPENRVRDFILDNNSNAFWYSISSVGITKFDGKEWEVYTPENSGVNCMGINKIALDKNGTLWCPNYQGLLKISPKK